MMDSKSYIEMVREKVKKDCYYLSHHAQIERGKERITVDDIVSAILSGQELEAYPDDPRGESCLIVGQKVRFQVDPCLVWQFLWGKPYNNYGIYSKIAQMGGSVYKEDVKRWKLAIFVKKVS